MDSLVEISLMVSKLTMFQNGERVHTESSICASEYGKARVPLTSTRYKCILGVCLGIADLFGDASFGTHPNHRLQCLLHGHRPGPQELTLRHDISIVI